MYEISQFKKHTGGQYEVYLNGDNIDTLTLVRADPLPAPPPEYTQVKQDPFEMVMRSQSDQAIDATVMIKDPEGQEFEIYLNPECFYDCPESGKRLVQYHCLFS
ncbi:hypothetical protein Rhal01_03491 [Rubritalea halochordaticola]|uniref:DUF6916 domain-containing protein n=1 Tax=Rubritalea halochordaticola TaxID=714537 RepID=A0ABP9V3Q3_9BACT